jgi:hypothetical protein
MSKESPVPFDPERFVLMLEYADLEEQNDEPKHDGEREQRQLSETKNGRFDDQSPAIIVATSVISRFKRNGSLGRLPSGIGALDEADVPRTNG